MTNNTVHNSAHYYANRANTVLRGDTYTNPLTGTVGTVTKVESDEYYVSYDMGDGCMGGHWVAR